MHGPVGTLTAASLRPVGTLGPRTRARRWSGRGRTGAQDGRKPLTRLDRELGLK